MSETTYGRLDDVLRTLGFSATVVEGKTRVYQHEPTGALIFLPEEAAAEQPIPHHLVVGRKVLQEYDIANPLEFEMRLRKAG